ncbi:hypothetical protein N7466_009677 [Penicillium verhagenii]|uniref:uncharacterized protein n=1 Tax=Penicillium verhagenii TaxID=1562060 RepID=UPI002544FE83|nr:uncharacterized protein N7466_009677 [Penicillium verhagenii]KAJ5921351.1 hypothetical protein N7466_009677 [Penicillium verhagenii]
MRRLKTNLRIVSTDEIWERNEDASDCFFSHTSIVAFYGETAYHGMSAARTTDLSKEPFLPFLKPLHPIPREDIYPKFSSRLTRAPEIYIRKPNLSLYSPDDGHEIADLLFHEAEIYEILRRHPHPGLGRSLGCVVGDDGRITGLALVKYNGLSLFQRAHGPEFLGEEQRNRCIEGLKAAVQHLHDLGLAHNDINPSNVMFTDDGAPILLDFATCNPIGTKLIKGGQVGEFENGIAVAKYELSSADCDNAAIEHISAWLKRMYDERKSKIEGRM